MKFDEHLESAKIGLTVNRNERESSHFSQAQIAPKVPQLAALLISPYFSSRKPKLRRCIAKLQQSKLSLTIGARAVPQFVVVNLKKGEFKPEHASKMNFYCSVVDDQLRHPQDQPTRGLILCQTKDRIIAEYSLRDFDKPIGVADYELTRALPEKLASSLPSIEAIGAELSQDVATEGES